MRIIQSTATVMQKKKNRSNLLFFNNVYNFIFNRNTSIL